MSLRQQFKLFFNNKQVITTSEMLVWYNSIKSGSEPARFSTLYSLVIKPMVEKSELVRLERGIYKIHIKGGDVLPTKDEDEWERYLEAKLTGKEVIQDGIRKKRDRSKVQD